jgi:nucleotide-binding universal stress UspA family protein
MSQRSVIAATDLSKRSAHVAGRAARLAQTLGARLILAHVGHDDAPGPLAGLGLGRSKETPETAMTALAEAHGAEVRLLVGDPSTELAKLATTENALLIVLGLHRERRVLDLLRLTTMERIVLDAPCPVLIAHQPPDHDYAQVLALSDFSAASAFALATAAQIAPDARFHAVHALRLPIGAALKQGGRESDAAREKAKSLREAFLAHPGLPALSEPPEIVPGGVHQVLAFRREELAADLVCIGAHSGRDPKALGNYARDLMRAPPTDLLVAKPA